MDCQHHSNLADYSVGCPDFSVVDNHHSKISSKCDDNTVQSIQRDGIYFYQHFGYRCCHVIDPMDRNYDAKQSGDSFSCSDNAVDSFGNTNNTV